MRDGKQSSTNCLMEFCVSFIIKQLLSVIDLRRAVSQSCGIRKPNCSEVLHYSTGILTWRLTRACQFLSGGMGIATLNHLPFSHDTHSHVYTHYQNWFMVKNYHMKLHTPWNHKLPLWIEVGDCCFALWSTFKPTAGLIYNELTDSDVSYSQQWLLDIPVFPCKVAADNLCHLH